MALACDVTRETECKRLVEAAVERWGRLDDLGLLRQLGLMPQR